MSIDAKLVAELRARTGLPMMKCKAALVEANGGVQGFVRWVEERRWGDDGRKAQILAWFLGVIIFIESNITVLVAGSISRPLFDRYGVQRVRDMDELATALIMFAELHPVPDGDLVSIHDSGGERQLMVDLADEYGVPLTRLSATTKNAIADVIDPELPAVNPLDGWSRGGPDGGAKMTSAFSLLLQDPDAALGVAVLDRGPDGLVYESYVERLRSAKNASGKSCALVASRQGTGDDQLTISATHEGLPVLDGVPGFLRGVPDRVYHIVPGKQPVPGTVGWRAKCATELDLQRLGARLAV